MPTSDTIYEVKCPSCGAPLQMSEERATCHYCGSVLERERPPVETQTPAVTPQEPQVVIIQRGYPNTYPQPKSGGSSCLSGLATLVVIVGLAGVFAWFQFPAEVSRLLNEAGLSNIAQLAQLQTQLVNKVSVTAMVGIELLPGGNDNGPDFLTFAYQTTGSNYALTYVEAAGSTIRWASPPLKESHNTRLAFSAETVYFTDETRLYAVNRADGQVVWQASLADKVPVGCRDCFALMADNLVALVQGGTVQAFNAQTGQLAWSRRLNFEPSSRIVPASDRLLILDRSEDNRHNVMVLVNPATWEGTGPITLPECTGQLVTLDPVTLYHPARHELYVLFSGPIGPPCLQVWDLAGPAMTREVLLEGLSIPLIIPTLTPEQDPLILAGDTIYLAANQTIDGAEASLVVALNPADGQWRVLAHNQDYNLVPSTTAGDVLLVRAVRSRGSQRNELWGLDSTTGETRWQYVLQASRQASERGAGEIWDWHLAPAGLAVLQVLDDPDQLTFDLLDPQTGVSRGQKTIPVSDSFFSDLAWTNEAVWVVLRQVYKIDLASGELSYTWP